MISYDSVRRVFLERGLDLNNTQAALLALLVQEMRDPPGDLEGRTMILHCGARKGHSTLWAAIARAYPESVVLCAATAPSARALDLPFCFTDILRRDLADKVVIVDGGAYSDVVRRTASSFTATRRPLVLVLG